MTAAPFGSVDQVIVARNSGAGCTLERWDPVARKPVATVRNVGPVKHLLAVGRSLVAAAEHEILIGPADLSSSPKPIWRTRRDILRIAPIRSGWLVLVADHGESPHPAHGQVYWFKSVSVRRPRLLSLRSVYNFWDIQSGDIDGDGSAVIALCTWSKTSRIRVNARRYFIYGLTSKDTYPRWRGSRLSKPYLAARLVKSGAGKDWKLLSVEQTGPGNLCLMLYQWDDFGFFGLGRSRNVAEAELVVNEYGAPLVRVSDVGIEELVQPAIEKGSLALKPICALHKGDSITVGRFGSKKIAILVTPSEGIGSSHIEQFPVLVPVPVPVQ